MQDSEDVLDAIQKQRTMLEADVEEKRAALEEAETKLAAFRANALSALGAASGSKSAQKQRAERQSVVAQLLSEGLSRAEIVRRTGLVDHLVGYDIDCIRKRRRKQGEKKVFASPPKSESTGADAPNITDDDVDDDKNSVGTEEDDGREEDLEAGGPSCSSVKLRVETQTATIKQKPSRPGVTPPGAAASREQLKLLAKTIQRRGDKVCRLVTTVDNDHFHVLVLDLMGDGETAKDETGHKHRACRFEMLESDHLHGVTLKEA